MPFRRNSPSRRTAISPERDLGALSDRQLIGRYRALDMWIDADDDPLARATQIDALAAEVLKRKPGGSLFWYDRGMYAKWRADWPAAIEYSRRALELVPDAQPGEPAAWNLGIAATASQDWSTARMAWAAFGIDLPQVADSRRPQTTLVSQVRSSGHRFGDIVLHDGDPVGTRRLDDDQRIGVFNEILLWQRCPVPTLTPTIQTPDPAAVQQLTDLSDAAGATAEDWTQNIEILCLECSNGSPRHDHQHRNSGWTPERSLGFSANLDRARALLEKWRAADNTRFHTELTVALP